MACDDDSYVLDADGNRILIGLTLDETREFERLDELISNLISAPADDSRSQKERRWLVLYDKHDASTKLEEQKLTLGRSGSYRGN
jgi:hypothetical protein